MFWDQIKSNLRRKNPDNSLLESWVGPVSLVSLEETSSGTRFRLGVPSELHQYWISQHLFDRICAEISEVYKAPFQVELVVSTESVNPVGKLESSALSASLDGSGNTNSQRQGGLIHPPQISAAPLQVRQDFLKSEYTFSSFVVGPNNEFAHACSFSVAERPGGVYNPLFICGPTGMGKTHLLNAVGNYIRDSQPDLVIRYVPAERFLNEFTSGIRRQEMDKFRSRFREKCDVLLMDDIQVLGRGESVQEEFFHTLNALFEKGKQVVVASDRMPKDIKCLEDRIRTRLEWGLIADIQMPDVETRVAILRYKAENRGIQIPNDVINFIARISKRSIRELEGNLNKVRMFTDLQGLPISLEVTKKVLATHSSEVSQLTMEDIQKLTAQHYGIRLPDLKSPTRAKPIVTARQMAMYLSKKFLEKSLMDIGRAFGGKDHTTVINAIRRIDDQLKENSDLKKDLDELETRIHNITGL